MDAAHLLRTARERSGLTLRQLAHRARTSHSTLAAYEAGRKVPTVTTLARVLRAAGFAVDAELRARAGGADPEARGRELLAVLDLADHLPARHESRLPYPRFGPA